MIYIYFHVIYTFILHNMHVHLHIFHTCTHTNTHTQTHTHTHTHIYIYKCGKDGREESLAEIYNISQFKMNSRNFGTICILLLNNRLQKLQMSLSLKEFKQKYKTQVTT